MKLNNTILAVPLLSLLAFPFTALAVSCVSAPPPNVPAWDFDCPGNNSFTNENWTFGEVFTPTQNITVDALGYFDNGTPGSFISDHPVGIFDASGNLLVQTVVTNSSTILDDVPGTSQYDNFLFNPVPLTELYAGDTYVIEGVSGSDPYVWNDNNFTVYAPLTILGNNYVLDGGLTFNGTGLINDVDDGYWGPDFMTTPEPGTLLLMGSGLAALAGMLRRKMRA